MDKTNSLLRSWIITVLAWHKAENNKVLLHFYKGRTNFISCAPVMKLIPTTSCSLPQTSDIMHFAIATRPFIAPSMNLVASWWRCYNDAVMLKLIRSVSFVVRLPHGAIDAFHGQVEL